MLLDKTIIELFIIDIDIKPGLIAQSVACQTADPGVASSVPAWSHTFTKIGHEIISTVILFLLIQEGLLSVISESMCAKYWLTT